MYKNLIYSSILIANRVPICKPAVILGQFSIELLVAIMC